MGHLLAHCSDISLFHALVIISKDLFSKLFLRFYWAFAMYNSCDEHSVRNMHFTNYPRQMYLITSWGKKKILFLLELFYWTKVLLSVKKVFVSCYLKKSAISEHWIFHLSLLFTFLKKCQMDIPEPEISLLNLMYTKAAQASTTTWLRLEPSSPSEVPIVKQKCMTTFWKYFGCQW